MRSLERVQVKESIVFESLGIHNHGKANSRNWIQWHHSNIWDPPSVDLEDPRVTLTTGQRRHGWYDVLYDIDSVPMGMLWWIRDNARNNRIRNKYNRIRKKYIEEDAKISIPGGGSFVCQMMCCSLVASVGSHVFAPTSYNLNHCTSMTYSGSVQTNSTTVYSMLTLSP